MEILRSFTPLVEPIALDEAFLDVGGARRLHGTGPEIAVAIRTRVHDETGLVASVGVASTKLLAKLASDLAKPDGLLVVEPGAELEFLHPLGVERLWGVGPATRRRLAELGVRTVGELADLPEDVLVGALGDAPGTTSTRSRANRDDRPVEPEQVVKSIGHEETFPVDVRDRASLERELGRLADGVASRLRAASLAGRTVPLKVRFGDFRTITRSRTLRDPTAVAADIAQVARRLLDGVPTDDGIRLLGVSVSKLGAETVAQPRLFDEPEPLTVAADSPGLGPSDADPFALDPVRSARRAAVEQSVDAVRARFGPAAVAPGGAAPPRGVDP